MKNGIMGLFVAAFALWGGGTANAAIKTSVASGNWAAPATWSSGTVPVLNDDVMITNGYTVTVGAHVSTNPGSITIASGSTLTIGAYALTNNGPTLINGTISLTSATSTKAFTGDVTIASGGTWSESAAAVVVFGGNLQNDGTLTAGAGVHTFSGTAKTIGGAKEIAIPKATIGGTCQNNGILTVNTTLVGSGTLTQGANSILNIGGTSLTFTLAANGSVNMVNYTAAGAQTVKATAYQNLTLSGSGAKSMASVTVNGVLSLEGTATASAAPTYGTSATLQYNTATARTNGNEWIATFVAAGGVVVSNTGPIYFAAGKIFSATAPLIIRSGATLADDGAGRVLTLAGDFINSGTPSLGAADVTINGTANQRIDGFITSGDVTVTKTAGAATCTGNWNGALLTTIGNGGTLNLGAGLTHTFASWNRTGSTTLNGGSSTLKIGGTVSATALVVFNAETGTVEYNGAGAQTAGLYTYNNLILSGGGIKTIGAGVAVNGILSMEGTATVSAAPTYGSSATLQYNRAAATTNGAEWINPFVAAGGIVITNTGSITLASAKTNSATAPLAIRSGATLASGNYKLTLGGVFTNEGAFTAGTGTVEWNGAGAQNIATGAYYNVIFSGSGIKSIGANTTVDGNLSIAPTGSASVGLASGLNLGVSSLTAGGLGRVNGTWGSTSSGATSKNDSYFSASTGYLTVGADMRTLPTVTTWPTSGGMTYLQSLSASALSGGAVTNVAAGVSVAGVFDFTTPATMPPAGVYSASVTFTPSDATSYSNVVGSVNVAVAKAAVTVTAAPTASTITYGQMLGASLLSGGAATNAAGSSVAGSVVFTSPDAIPNVGTASQSVTFVPADAANYNTAVIAVDVTVNPRAVVLTGARAYDGTSVANYGVLKVANKVGADTVSVASGSASLASSSEGAWAAITSFGTLALGNNALGNYTLTGASGSVAIGAVPARTNTYYVVSANPLAASPFDTWGNAAADIQTAANKASADLIPGTTECQVLVSNGTYTLTSQIAISNAIALVGFSGNPADTIIRGGYPASTNRCLYITGANAVVDGFTITNGYVTEASPSANYGGGVYMATNATLRNCTVSGNQAKKGGLYGRGCGVYLAYGGLIANCTLSFNTSDHAAGVGAYLANGGLVSGCTIVSNTLTAPLTGSDGGGLYVSGDSVVSNCVIAYNNARLGGGVFLDYANQVILCTIRDNMATFAGGGVYFNRGPGIVNRCRILRNTSITGGGLHLAYNDHVWDSLIAGNQASASGGGIHINNTSTKSTIRNCTIVRNKADATCGGVSMAVSNCLNMYNTIICDNTAVTTNNVGGPVGTSILQYNCTTDPDVAAEGNISNNPLFVDSGLGSGVTAALGDYTLQLSSPCIGAGTNAAVTNSLDLAGNARIRPSWGAVDMGAYEAQPLGGALTNKFTASPVVGATPLPVVFTGETSGNNNGLLYQWIFGDGVTNDWSINGTVTHTYVTAGTSAYTATMNVTNAGGETSAYNLPIMVYPDTVYVATNGSHIAPFDTWAKAASNIQAAIDVAVDGYTMAVIVSNGTYTVTTHIALDKGLTVRSVTTNWADVIIKGGYPASTNRCFYITSANAVLDGCTITNGNWTNATAGSAGGGILMSAGIVRNCLIIGNAAKGYGGGIEMTGGRLLSCAVLNNSVPNGYGGGIHLNNASAIASNCLVAGNLAVAGSGGGLRVGVGTLVDSVISNNAAGSGGGIYHQGAGLIANCRIVANQSTADGGGVWSVNPGRIRNCLIAGNASSKNGGGIALTGTGGGSVENCTIVGNSAATNGGWHQTAVSTGVNCIVSFNQATNNPATADIGGTKTNFLYSCSSTLVDGVDSNITANPMFVSPGVGYGTNLTAGNYRLKAGSPCLAKGTNLAWMATAVDLAGDAFTSPPAMGAYQKAVGATSRGTLMLIR